MPSPESVHARQPICASKVRLIHVARQQTGLGEEDFRAMLACYGGVASTTQLDQKGFTAVMERFKALGFRSTSKRRPEAVRAGMASPPQVSLIRHLWAECTHGEGTDSSLGKWLERQFHLSSVRFVTAELAPKVIGGLMGMRRQVGRRDAKVAATRAVAGDAARESA